MPITRKRTTVFRRKPGFKSGGSKRFRRSARPSSYRRKSYRPVYKTRGRKTLRNTRPTPNSLAKSANVTKVIDFEQNPNSNNGALSAVSIAHAGQTGLLILDQTPRISAIKSIFGAAFAFNGTNATYDNTKPGQNGFYADAAKVAVEAKRTNTVVNTTNVKAEVTIYRIRARSNVLATTSGGVGAQEVYNYVGGLLGQVNAQQVVGLTTSPLNVIGITPFDSPGFCEQFKILSTKKRVLKPSQKWISSYKNRPRIYEAKDIQLYGIMKGAIIDLVYFQGEIGHMSATASNGLALQVTTGPTALGILSRWDYTFVPEARTNVYTGKYILNQVPNDTNVVSTAYGASDANWQKLDPITGIVQAERSA